MAYSACPAREKTTLIKILAGDDRAHSGTIVYGERDVSKLDRSARGFHFPKITNENVWRSIFKTGQASQLADGEGQLLALENALDRASGVLLLDNSFCNMDASMRERAFELLRAKVAEQQLVAIFASNDFEEIFLACSKAAVLAEGTILQFGTPRDVYDTPAKLEVARATDRNNLFAARRLTSSKADVTEFITIDGEHRLFARTQPLSAMGALNRNVTIGIRPEHVSISFGASFPADNILKASIEKVTYLGSRTLVTLNADGLKLDALVLRLVGLTVDDECMVGLPPDRIQIYPD